MSDIEKSPSFVGSFEQSYRDFLTEIDPMFFDFDERVVVMALASGIDDLPQTNFVELGRSMFEGIDVAGDWIESQISPSADRFFIEQGMSGVLQIGLNEGNIDWLERRLKSEFRAGWQWSLSNIFRSRPESVINAWLGSNRPIGMLERFLSEHLLEKEEVRRTLANEMEWLPYYVYEYSNNVGFFDRQRVFEWAMEEADKVLANPESIFGAVTGYFVLAKNVSYKKELERLDKKRDGNYGKILNKTMSPVKASMCYSMLARSIYEINRENKGAETVDTFFKAAYKALICEDKYENEEDIFAAWKVLLGEYVECGGENMLIEISDELDNMRYEHKDSFVRAASLLGAGHVDPRWTEIFFWMAVNDMDDKSRGANVATEHVARALGNRFVNLEQYLNYMQELLNGSFGEVTTAERSLIESLVKRSFITGDWSVCERFLKRSDLKQIQKLEVYWRVYLLNR